MRLAKLQELLMADTFIEEFDNASALVNMDHIKTFDIITHAIKTTRDPVFGLDDASLLNKVAKAAQIPLSTEYPKYFICAAAPHMDGIFDMAVERLKPPVEISAPVMFATAAVGVLINIVLASTLHHDHAHHDHAHHDHDHPHHDHHEQIL